jgi:hypothetical protein
MIFNMGWQFRGMRVDRVERGRIVTGSPRLPDLGACFTPSHFPKPALVAREKTGEYGVERMRKRLIIFLARLTPSCQQVCRCASEQLEESHSPWMRFKIWIHFKLCRACEVYSNQLRALHDNLARNSEEFRSDEKLSDETRERMRAAMRGESGG